MLAHERRPRLLPERDDLPRLNELRLRLLSKGTLGDASNASERASLLYMVNPVAPRELSPWVPPLGSSRVHFGLPVARGTRQHRRDVARVGRDRHLMHAPLLVLKPGDTTTGGLVVQRRRQLRGASVFRSPAAGGETFRLRNAPAGTSRGTTAFAPATTAARYP